MTPTYETSETWEHEGVTYNPGDPIKLTDRRGSFSFRMYEKDVEKDSDWIWVFREGYYKMAVRPDRVKPPKRKKKQVVVKTPTETALCSVHRKYKAVRKPKVDCKECWSAYDERHPS